MDLGFHDQGGGGGDQGAFGHKFGHLGPIRTMTK